MKIVLDALCHEASGSRTDSRIGASGYTSLNSFQNGAAGQSTTA
jgi:hypothetical protein